MKVEEAIKKAIEEGFLKGGKWMGNDVPPIHELEWMALLSDWANEYQFAWITSKPSFWQSLGKALGWDNERDLEDYLDAHEGRMPKHFQWQGIWHRFIDHLATGKDAASFFELL